MTARNVTPILTDAQQRAQVEEETTIDRLVAERRQTPAADSPQSLPPSSSGGAVGRGEMAVTLPRDHIRQRISSAVGLHLGNKLPGIEWTSAVDPIADRFYEMFGDDPAVVSALESDVNTLYALTDDDFAQRIVDGEPVAGQFADVFDAIAEVAWEVGATDLAAKLEAEKSDAIAGTFNALTGDEAFAAGQQYRAEGLPEAIGGAALGEGTRSRSFESVFGEPGAWSFSPSSGVLAVTVGDESIGVEVRPGFDPESHLDVMVEVVAAQAEGRVLGGELTGKPVGTLDPGTMIAKITEGAHKVGGWLDEHPGASQSVDALWESFLVSVGDPGALGRRVRGESRGAVALARDRLADAKGNITAESVRLASFIPYPEEATIAAVARAWMEDNPGVTSDEALALAAEHVTENREQFVEEFQRLTQDELIEQLEAELEDQSALGGAVEAGLAGALEKMEWWDRITQTIGVNFIDAWRDVLGAGAEFLQADWREGFERFKDVFDAPAERTAGDYFDLEGGAADAANLAVGVVFDPLNWVFAGAKGVRKIASEALTNPKYAGIYLRMGQIPKIVKQIAGTTRSKAGLWVDGVVDDAAVNEIRGLGLTVGEAESVFGADSPQAVAARALEEAAASEARAVRNVAAMSGLGDDEIIDLVRLARDPKSTPGQVNEVLTRALHKDWLGEGPNRAIRHSTIEGFGRTLEGIAAGRVSDEHLDTLMKYVSKASVGRTFKLGENQALDNFADLLTMLHPADKDKFAEWFLRAVERRAAVSDDLATAGAGQLVKEQARRSIWETGGTVRAIEGGADIRAANQNLRTIEQALTDLPRMGLDDEAQAALRSQLERMHSVMSRRVDDAKPKLARQAEKRRTAKKQLKQAAYLDADAANNAARNEMAATVKEFYDEIAVSLNDEWGYEVIPVVKGKTDPLAPHVPVRDWSAVTGVKPNLAGDDPDLALMMGLSVGDPGLATQAGAIGMFNQSQKLLLPASPYEVILFQKLGKNTGAFQKVTQFLRNEGLKKWSARMKLVFATNLLVNPLTAGKVTLDETLRFLADTGDYAGFVRATLAGIPGVGSASEAVVERLAARFGDAVASPYAASYQRNVGGFYADDFANYQWVERPPRRVAPGKMTLSEYAGQVERWINGTLLQDRRFREYARWVDAATVLDDGTKIPPVEFVEWWEKGAGVARPGKADVRMTTVSIRDTAVLGTELTATDAFNILDNVFNHWLEMVVDESSRTPMRRALLKAATASGDAGRLDAVKDARLLKAVERVPGLDRDTGLGSSIFNIFFGGPSGRRAGVFYEHYFDEAMRLLTERHKGRILGVDELMEYAKVDRQTADYWLKQGSENAIVSKLIRQQGMRTEAQLAARAAAYAERRADDLMYQFTATSLAGRGVEAGLMFPFARAQVDFLSWWTDYLTKPMTLRIGMEARAKLPGVVQDMIAKVEQMPLNLRGMANYAHLVSMVNNDQPSVLDQAIDNLTFFPVHYDSNFLIDVSPQLGAIPSWLFDIAVDKGVIPEGVAENIEALFPALGYTDESTDLWDRILPNSRKSIRDLTVGMVRGGYAIVGKDIHTDPGKIGQIANMIGNDKVPAATGDFQAALVADVLAEKVWELVPGSPEWNDAIRAVAVAGAVEANRQEWGQDFKDRTFPLTGYDAEYRALRAFSGVFDEGIYSTMVQAGIFDSNDLFEEDGVPRIRAAWDRYQEGTATDADLQFLDDRLHSAYFDAGRVEVLPGFSYLDYLNLVHPELAVNLVSKNEDSGIPVRSDEHAAFKNEHINALTGRLQNIPPGDEGREVVLEARRKGWLVSRPVEEWATDAAEAVYKSGQRAIRGVWERVSGRTWQQGVKRSIENRRFTLRPREALILQRAGMTIEGGQEFTYGEFHDLLDDFDERFDVAQPVLINTLERGAVHGQLSRHDDGFGLGLLDDLAEADREFNKLGIESVEDWPEASKEEARRRFNEAITLGYTTLDAYNQEIKPIFGPLDYEPPTPPPVGEVEAGFTIEGDDLADVDVVDGDTIAVMLADGPMRVRLIGINAPEVTQPGYAEARANLAKVVAAASSITVGIYQPELFGVTQKTAPGERRLLAWLYVDGVPLYDPSVFTADNPRGAGVGGEVLDLQRILEETR